MAKRNTNSNRPVRTVQPAPATEQSAGGMPTATATILAMPEKAVAQRGPIKTIFDVVMTENSKAALAKVQALQDVRQRLAEAQDYFTAGSDKAREGAAIAENAALKLYQARTDGLISADELSGLLGDVFGYKVAGKPQAGATPVTTGVPKDFSKNGQKASKTPYGQGETLRKRVVRLCAADEYVADGTANAFFEGLPVEEVTAILDQVKAAENPISVYTAFDLFAKLKREHTDRTNPAFDAAKVAALAETLAEDGAAAKVRNNPDLVAAYAALIGVLDIIGEVEAEAA